MRRYRQSWGKGREGREGDLELNHEEGSDALTTFYDDDELLRAMGWKLLTSMSSKKGRWEGRLQSAGRRWRRERKEGRMRKLSSTFLLLLLSFPFPFVRLRLHPARLSSLSTSSPSGSISSLPSLQEEEDENFPPNGLSRRCLRVFLGTASPLR